MELTEDIRREFDAVASEVQTMNFLGRARELQEDALHVCSQFLGKLRALKTSVAAGGRERAANEILAMELSLEAVSNELQMWIELGKDEPEKAWNHLIVAQGALRAAGAVRRQLGIGAEQLESLLRRLLYIEQLFPPQTFCSVGGVVHKRECSICGKHYEDCDHVAGRAYSGQLCVRIIREFTEIHEVSIVENPADRRCRATHFSEGDQFRNKMTWRLEQSKGSGWRPAQSDVTVEGNGRQSTDTSER